MNKPATIHPFSKTNSFIIAVYAQFRGQFHEECKTSMCELFHHEHSKAAKQSCTSQRLATHENKMSERGEFPLQVIQVELKSALGPELSGPFWGVNQVL